MIPRIVSSVLLVSMLAGCNRSFTRREIYDSRTPAQLIAAGDEAVKTLNDLSELYRRDLGQGIALLDRIPGKFEAHPNWGAQWSILTAAYDHSRDEQERLAAGKGIPAQEVNAIMQHREAQTALNRAWVVQGSPTANAEAVLAQLGSPKPWPDRTSLASRISGGSAADALETERRHLYNFAGLMSQMVDVAKRKALDGVAYWDTESRAVAGVYAIVEADAVAIRKGEALSDRRITSAFDMAYPARTLMGYRLSEASAPVLYARAVLSADQARALQGTNFGDTAALAQFRGFWQDARSKVNRGWVSAVIAQDSALRGTLFRDIPAEKLGERGPGLLDSEIDQNPDALLMVWWCFRAIPPSMFHGNGSYALPSPVALDSDSSNISEMVSASQPRVFVPAPAPAPEDTEVPSGPAKPAKK